MIQKLLLINEMTKLTKILIRQQDRKNFEATKYLDLQYFQILHQQKFPSTEKTL